MSSSKAEKAHSYEKKVKPFTSASCHSGDVGVENQGDYALKWVENEFPFKGGYE